MTTIRTTALLTFFLLISLGSSQAETLTIPGTGACELLLKELSEAFTSQNPGSKIFIPPSTGSGGGIESALNDKALMGRVARPLKSDEKGLEYLVFAMDSVVFASGAKVGVDSLTADQLADIFEGRINSWDQVGGPDARIRVLIRQAGDSSFDTLDKHIPSFSALRFSTGAKTLYHDYEMVEMLIKYRYSIGWLPGAALLKTDKKIHAMSIDGVSPTPENMISGKYKATGEYALVFKNNRLDSLAKRFLDFIFSEKGRDVIMKAGVVPVR